MSALEILQSNNIKTYQIANSARSAIPEWLAKQKKKALKHDSNWQQRVELIQDFDFPEASIRLRPTRDGQYILATGIFSFVYAYEYAKYSNDKVFINHASASMISRKWP
jgi:ribosome biogenesis protein ENP2